MQTAGQTSARVKRRRSVGFPVLPLTDASTVLKEIGKYGEEHSIATIAELLGHSSANSGAFRQKLAALRDWGLVSGRGERLAMTDVGRAIAYPRDPEGECLALRDAFMSCSVFARLYKESQKGQLLALEQLGNVAVLELGISPKSKDKFVESFARSAVKAGLAELGPDQHIILKAFEAVEGAHRDAEDGVDFDSHLVEFDTHSQSKEIRGEHGPTLHQVWQVGRVTIKLEIMSDGPLPASAFNTIGDVVQRIETLAERLSAEPLEADNQSEG
ncbi:MAG: hypothetical protein KatS3mg008_1240 [Acidimicrobiales bacterium]|nr:MAG: hypothetical protein KatS3mg008_1240 [Acidimicrobiales bacterium]